MEHASSALRDLKPIVFAQPLYPRQEETLLWMLAGLYCKAIGQRMGIRITTVRTYTADLLRLSGAETRHELTARIWAHRGWEISPNVIKEMKEV